MEASQTTIAVRDNQWSDADRKVLLNTVARGLNDSELMVFAKYCQETGLNPFRRQIYAIKIGGSLTIQTGIDGFRSMAEETGKYAGSDDAEFETDGNTLVSAKVAVYKMVEGVRCAFSATAYWSEYNVPNGNMWRKMPHTMLGKCAEALALRKAFPGKLSGIYTKDEMDQADTTVVDAEVVEDEPRRVIPPKQQVNGDGEVRTPPQAVAGMNKQPLVDLINAMEGVMYNGDLERIKVIRDKQGIPKEAIETTGKNLKKYTDLLSQELDVKIELGEGQIYKVKKATDAARKKYLGDGNLHNVTIETKLDYLIHMRAKKVEKEKAA